MAEFNRFDIVEAHYLFLSEYHEGQSSEKYVRLSSLSGPKFRFSPRPSLHSWCDLEINGQEIYWRLVARDMEWSQERLQSFLQVIWSRPDEDVEYCPGCGGAILSGEPCPMCTHPLPYPLRFPDGTVNPNAAGCIQCGAAYDSVTGQCPVCDPELSEGEIEHGYQSYPMNPVRCVL